LYRGWERERGLNKEDRFIRTRCFSQSTTDPIDIFLLMVGAVVCCCIFSQTSMANAQQSPLYETV
jgi:hypothetical protein